MATAVWAVAAITVPPQQNQHIQQAEASSDPSANQHQVAKSFGERLAKIWERTWEDPVAFFTFMLSIFTALLAIVAAVQIGFLFRTDKTARIAAEAASLNARAAVGVELPILILDDLSFWASDRPERAASIGIEQKVPRFRYCKVGELRVGNGGRTPAFPSEIGLGFTIGSELPSSPTYAWTRPCSASDSIRPGKTLNFDCWPFHIEMDEKIRKLLDSEEAVIWVYTRVQYADFLGEMHEHRVVWVWAPYGGRFAFRKPTSPPPEYTQKG